MSISLACKCNTLSRNGFIFVEGIKSILSSLL